MAAQNLDGTKFFDCEGPNSKFIELFSKEGEQFFLKRKYALLSPKMKEMLSSPENFAETSINKITLHDIRSVILVEVCKYLKFKAKYSKRILSSTNPIFEMSDDLELSMELMVAADFLEI